MTAVSPGVFIGKLLGLFILALGIIAVLYFAFPNVYQRMTESGPADEESLQHAGEQITRSLDELEESLEDAGVSREETERIMEQIDREAIERILREGVDRGVETSEQLFEVIRRQVNFGEIHSDSVRDAFLRRTAEIDFQEVFRELGRAIEEGISSLEKRIEGMEPSL